MTISKSTVALALLANFNANGRIMGSYPVMSGDILSPEAFQYLSSKQIKVVYL